MEAQDHLDDLIARSAELRARSVRECAVATGTLIVSAQLIANSAEIHEDVICTRAHLAEQRARRRAPTPGWRQHGIPGAALDRDRLLPPSSVT